MPLLLAKLFEMSPNFFALINFFCSSVTGNETWFWPCDWQVSLTIQALKTSDEKLKTWWKCPCANSRAQWSNYKQRGTSQSWHFPRNLVLFPKSRHSHVFSLKKLTRHNMCNSFWKAEHPTVKYLSLCIVSKNHLHHPTYEIFQSHDVEVKNRLIHKETLH